MGLEVTPISASGLAVFVEAFRGVVAPSSGGWVVGKSATCGPVGDEVFVEVSL